MVGGGVSTFRHLLFCTNRILSVPRGPTEPNVPCLYYVYQLYLVCAMCTNRILSVTTALLCQLYLVCTMCTKCANRILSVPSVPWEVSAHSDTIQAAPAFLSVPTVPWITKAYFVSVEAKTKCFDGARE